MIPEIFVTFAVLMSNIANFPQIWQMIKTKSAKDLNIITNISWVLITFIMALHAIEINDIYFIISGIGQCIINIVIFMLIIKYR